MFSARKTEKLLGSGKIQERDSYSYYAVGVVLACIITQYSIWLGASPGNQFLMESVLTVVITIWGLYHWWESNGKNDGRAFVTRVVFLSVPVGILTFSVNLLLGWLVFYFAIELFGSGSFRSPERAYGFVAYSLSFGTYLWYWLWIGVALKRLRNNQEEI